MSNFVKRKASCAVKVYIHFCFDDEDSFEDETDDYIAAELAIAISFEVQIVNDIAFGNVCFMISMVHINGAHQWCTSMVHIMVLLRYLGFYWYKGMDYIPCLL